MLNLFMRVLDPVPWCVSRIRINDVAFETIDGCDYVLKRRSLISPVLILLSIGALAMRRVPVRVMYQKEWVQWEGQIHAANDVAIVDQRARGLMVPKVAGRPLAEFLSSETCDNGEVVSMLSAAMQELYRFHQIQVESKGQSCLLSHGDASISNVLFDKQSQSCRWIDFDLRHDLSRSADLRHADDLRAFLFTAVQSLSVERCSEAFVRELLASMREAYPKERAWQSLAEIMNDPGFAFDIFHRAQLFRLKTKLSPDGHQMLKRLLG